MDILIDILMCILIWISSLAGIVLLKLAFFSEGKELEKLRKENRELREEVERVRRHYEQLLRDTIVRNNIMVALYNAWKSGSLKKCYMEGGEIRILADGTVICEMPDKEKSYAIGGTGGTSESE